MDPCQLKTLDLEFSTNSKICYPCVGTTSNANLSGPQKELLMWHWNLGISMYFIQELKFLQPIEAHESSGICCEMPLVITPDLKSTTNPKTTPFCLSWQLACTKSVCLKSTNHALSLSKGSSVSRCL